jgi:hypothetical protein
MADFGIKLSTKQLQLRSIDIEPDAGFHLTDFLQNTSSDTKYAYA